MPSDWPMLRVSAYIAAPSLRSAGDSVENTITESGTNISPPPIPWTSPATISVWSST